MAIPIADHLVRVDRFLTELVKPERPTAWGAFHHAAGSR